MSLDVYLYPSSDVRAAAHGRRHLALDDDGILTCIREHVGSLPSLTGHPIDPYADAVFDASLLPALKKALASAHSAYASGPPILAVRVGTEIKPVRRALYENVARKKLLSTISALQALAASALQAQQCLIFCGD